MATNIQNGHPNSIILNTDVLLDRYLGQKVIRCFQSKLKLIYMVIWNLLQKLAFASLAVY